VFTIYQLVIRISLAHPQYTRRCWFLDPLIDDHLSIINIYKPSIYIGLAMISLIYWMGLEDPSTLQAKKKGAARWMNMISRFFGHPAA